MIVETLIFVESYQIYDEINGEKIWIFDKILKYRFDICCSNLLFYVMLESLKILIFPRENQYFYEKSLFAFDVQRYQKFVKT